VSAAQIKPCKRGHTAGRTKNGKCASYRRESVRKSVHKWKTANREKHRENERNRYAANLEQAREKVRKSVSKWKGAHPEKVRARGSRRRALKRTQRCGCCTDTQIAELHAQAMLYSGHVDHIVPLALGGPHCIKNLQAMTDVDHREKTKHDLRAITEARRRSRLLRGWRLP
jgi:hypothetical protein